MSKVTFNNVVHKCLSDETFFEALKKDPKKALTDARMELSDQDMEVLHKNIKDEKMMADFLIYVGLWKKYRFPPMQGFLPIW